MNAISFPVTIKLLFVADLICHGETGLYSFNYSMINQATKITARVRLQGGKVYVKY